MKKEILLSTAALTGTVLVGVNAPSVQAANVDNGENVATVTKQQTSTKDTAQANLNDAKNQQVNAQENANSAQADLNNAKENVADLNKAVDNAQAEVSHAKEVKQAATPENIEKAKNVLKDQQDTVAQEQNNVQKAQDNVNDKQATVTDATNTVNNAQASVDEAQKEVNVAQSNVDTAQKVLDGTNVQEVKGNLTKAQTQVKQDTVALNAKQATVTDMQQKLETEKQNVKNDSNAVEKANSQVSEKQNTENATAQARKQAQANVDVAKTNAEVVQTKADDAKKVLDGTNAQEIIDRSKATKGQVEVDKISVDSKQKAVEQAENAKITLEKDLNKAQNDVNSANANVLVKQAEAAKTQSSLNTAQTERDNVHKTVTDLKDRLSSINTIVLPNGFAQGWDDLINERTRSYAKLNEFTDEGFEINQFKHNEKDKNIEIDPQNFTTEQQKTITLWIARLLNQIRKQMGFKNRVVVTEDSLKYAQVITQNTPKDKFDHSLTAIKKGEEAIGGTWGSSEAIAMGSYNKGSLDSFKNQIYWQILSMIFDDAHSNWGHAEHLLGVRGHSDKVTHFGFDIDVNGVTHYESYMPVKEDNNFITIPNNTEKLQEQLKNAQVDLQAKQAAFAITQSQNNSAQSALKNAKDNLSQLQKDLSDKQNKVNSATNTLRTAQVDFDNAKATLAHDQLVAQNAQQAVDNMSADFKTKQANYEAALNELAKARKVLDSKQAELENATKADENAKADLSSAQGKLINAKQALNTSNSNVAQLTANLNTARKAVKEAQAKLVRDQAIVTKAQQAVNALDADVAVKLANLNQTKAELASKQQALQAAQIVLNAKKVALRKAQQVLVATKQMLANAQDTHEKAQVTAKQLANKLFELENADMLLLTANNNLNDAKAELAQAKADLKNKQNAYELAQADLTAKTAKVKEYEAVLSRIVAQEEAQKALKEAEAKAKQLAEEKAKNHFFYQAGNKLFNSNGKPAVSYMVHGDRVFDARGDLVGYVSNEVKSRKVRIALQAQEGSLPQTGEKADKTSLVGAVILGLSSLLGFVAIDHRKKKEF